MNAPMMSKLQLCSATGACPRAVVEAAPPRQPAAPRTGLSPTATRRAAAAVLGATLLAVGAAGWLVLSRDVPPLPIVELPRVVIVAKRLPAGSCPVPVEPAGIDCPIPTPAATDDLLIEPLTARSTQP